MKPNFNLSRKIRTKTSIAKTLRNRDKKQYSDLKTFEFAYYFQMKQ